MFFITASFSMFLSMVLNVSSDTSFNNLLESSPYDAIWLSLEIYVDILSIFFFDTSLETSIDAAHDAALHVIASE